MHAFMCSTSTLSWGPAQGEGRAAGRGIEGQGRGVGQGLGVRSRAAGRIRLCRALAAMLTRGCRMLGMGPQAPRGGGTWAEGGGTQKEPRKKNPPEGRRSPV